MPDWFTNLLNEVTDEVIASPETRAKLALTDRVTRKSLKADLQGLTDELRGQFAANVRTIQQLDEARLEAVRAALPREWDAVIAAERDLTRAGKDVPDRVWRPAAKAAVAAARREFDRSAADMDLNDREPVASISSDRARAISALRKLIFTLLTLVVNETIDAALDDSYGRDFSYIGQARLTDPLDASVQQPVNTEAYRKIRYQVEKIGSGTIGVAGPRGSGKSTLLNRFAVSVVDSGGNQQQWGVCVAAPTSYEPRDFLLHLFGQLCVTVLGPSRTQRIERELTGTTPVKATQVFPLTQFFLIVGTTVAACLGVIIGLLTSRPVTAPYGMTDLLVASCCAVVAVAVLIAPVRSVIPLLIWRQDRRWYGGSRQSWRELIESNWKPTRPIVLPLVAVAAVLFGLVRADHSPDPGYLAAAGLGVVTIAGTCFLFFWMSPAADGSRAKAASERRYDPRADAAIAAARDWYRKVKFQQSFTTGWSGTVTLSTSALPVQLQAGRSGSREVTPLAMSTPEIVDAFRSFTDLLGSPYGDDDDRIPVVVGIDEVDKIEDPQEAPVADLLFVLSGGLPRELVRFIRRAVEVKERGEAAGRDTCWIEGLARELAADEAEAQQKAVLARGRTLEPCELRDALLAWATRRQPADDGAYTYNTQRYLADLLAQGAGLTSAHGPAATPDHPAHADNCAARETGAFLVWLATAGQSVLSCSGKTEFKTAESPDGGRSFSRLAEARQNFPLGPDYVLAASRDIRSAGALPEAVYQVE